MSKVIAVKTPVTLYLGRIAGVDAEFFNKIHGIARDEWAINRTASLQAGKDAICVTSLHENQNTPQAIKELNILLEICARHDVDVFCTPDCVCTIHGSNNFTEYFVCA